MKGLSNAIPTIATKTGGPSEHIVDEYNGIFIEKYLPNNRPSPEGLIEALAKASNVYSSMNQYPQSWDMDYFRMMWNALQTTPKVDIDFVVKRYIKELWLPAYRAKFGLYIEKTKQQKEEAISLTKTKLACQIPIYSLRNEKVKYGIGKFTDLINTYEEVLKPSGVSTIQILPHFAVSYESPYAPISIYAINELYIDWIKEAEELGLDRKKIEAMKEKLESIPQDYVYYDVIKEIEFEASKTVFVGFKDKKEFELFRRRNSFWLDNYSSYASAKRILARVPNNKEEIEEVAKQNPGVFETYKSLYEFIQYVGYKQLKETVDVLHKEGCKIMFDIPFFRAKDSVDITFHSEYFHSEKKSPYIWGQHWEDLVLFNWDSLQRDNYDLLIAPIKHWLKFSFDGVRLDALHFAYNLSYLKENVVQSGNEKGNDFVSKLITEIRKTKPDSLILAEAFEGTDEHIRSNYGIYTIANVDWFDPQQLSKISTKPKIWLQITSHDAPRIQNNVALKEKYNIEYNEESFVKFFEKVLSSGVEFVAIAIGDQWGDEREEKEYKDGRSFWRYRIPFPSNRKFDIKEALKNIVFSSNMKTEQGYFNSGYFVGKNLSLPITEEIKGKLKKLQHFKLLYNEGKTELPFGDIVAPGLHCILVCYQWIKFVGEKGKFSLYHHIYYNDFFKKVYTILEEAGLTEDKIPEVYSYIKYLNRQASATTDVEQKANINIQLFGFIQGLLENTLLNEYVKNANKEIKENRDVFSKLLVAADSFVAKDEKGNTQILAGYPWFIQSWGRDTFISLTGILLTTKRFDEAKEVFRYYLKYQRDDGTIPNIIYPDGRASYNTADAPLWFIEALYRYYKMTKDVDFVKEVLPSVNKIIEFYRKPQSEIYLDSDNLVLVPPQHTWMDTKYTPRSGKPVEIQALFYNALSILSELNREIVKNYIVAQEYNELKNKVKSAIIEKFFEGNRDYPYDVIDGNEEERSAIRPNAILLLSLSKVDDLLNEQQKQKITDVVEKELLTPYGLKTLSSKDKNYIGRYDTFAPIETKDKAYHQGIIWPWLIREYVFAKLKLISYKPYNEFIEEIKEKINNLIYYVRENNTIPEIFEAEPPNTRQGCVSQAWSVAAMLDVFDLINKEEKPSIKQEEIKQIFSIENIKQILGAV